jgi:recombination DNA repair RAD52 pathway protein
MQTNLEQVTNLIRTLPLEDLDKLREVIDIEKNAKLHKKEESDWRIERYKKARKWLDEHSQEYMNKWVCLEGDKLIAVDNDGRTVYKQAKDAGIEIPFIHHIVDESMPFGGW